jgi:hypothetical protein
MGTAFDGVILTVIDPKDVFVIGEEVFMAGTILAGWDKLEAIRVSDPDVAAVLTAIDNYNEAICDEIAKLRRDKRRLKRKLRRARIERDQLRAACVADGVTVTDGAASAVWVLTISGVDGVTISPWVSEG